MSEINNQTSLRSEINKQIFDAAQKILVPIPALGRDLPRSSAVITVPFSKRLRALTHAGESELALRLMRAPAHLPVFVSALQP